MGGVLLLLDKIDPTLAEVGLCALRVLLLKIQQETQWRECGLPKYTKTRSSAVAKRPYDYRVCRFWPKYNWKEDILHRTIYIQLL